LDHAKAALYRFYTALRGLPTGPVADTELGGYGQRFFAAMDDDFNSAEAVAVLFDLARELNRLKANGDEPAAMRSASMLVRLGSSLGLLQGDADAYLKGGSATSATSGVSDSEIDALVQQRVDAKKGKNWKEADRLRDVLKEQGVVVEDFPQGSTWRRV